MLGKIIGLSTVAAGILLLFTTQFTNPSTAGPLGLLAVFFLLYIVILGVTTELLWVGSKGLRVVANRFTVKQPFGRLSLQRAYYLSTVIALGPIMVIAMLSIGTLGPYELFLIAAFLSIGLLYVSRRSAR